MKRLNYQEVEKVKSFFESGKNVSQEIIDINESKAKVKVKTKISKEQKINYFTNRLIRKS